MRNVFNAAAGAAVVVVVAAASVTGRLERSDLVQNPFRRLFDSRNGLRNLDKAHLDDRTEGCILLLVSSRRGRCEGGEVDGQFDSR